MGLTQTKEAKKAVAQVEKEIAAAAAATNGNCNTSTDPSSTPNTATTGQEKDKKCTCSPCKCDPCVCPKDCVKCKTEEKPASTTTESSSPAAEVVSSAATDEPPAVPETPVPTEDEEGKPVATAETPVDAGSEEKQPEIHVKEATPEETVTPAHESADPSPPAAVTEETAAADVPEVPTSLTETSEPNMDTSVVPEHHNQ